MKRERIEFEGSLGEKIRAEIDFPEKHDTEAFAIFAHCFTCNKNYKSVRSISRHLAKNKIATLRLDFTGLGQSEGDFSATNLETNIADLKKAAEFLESGYQPPKLLIGHSFGGASALLSAREISSVRAVAIVASASSLKHLHDIFYNKSKLENKGHIKIRVGGNSFELKDHFFEKLRKTDYQKYLEEFSHPAIIFHSPQDEILSYSEGLKLFETLSGPKNFITVDGADHLFMREQDQEFVGKMLSAWAFRYID